jgi:hypothetical protein
MNDNIVLYSMMSYQIKVIIIIIITISLFKSMKHTVGN